MKINKKEYDSYTIHHYKSNKYKTIYIKVIFRKPIKKEEITKTNLLFAVLGSGTNKYENEKLINIQMEELYGITTSASTRRVGTNLQQYITLEVLDDKYTEPGNLDKSIELFSELLLDPLVKDNAFDKDIVEREKGIFESYYKRIKENPSYYAYVRANEEYNDKSIISYRQNGYMEDLKDITEHNLYEYYKEFLKSNVIDIVVVGNIEFTKIDKLINKHFSNLKSISNKENKYLLNEKLLNKQIIKREKINNTQSNLVMCLSCTDQVADIH